MPSLGHDNKVGDQISHLSGTIDVIEGRVLYLVTDRTQDAPLDDFITELSLLAKDLRKCYRKLADLKERRDLPFTTVEKLRGLDQRCVWLYRNIHLEQAFYTKLDLERKLRTLMSSEAFSLYQEYQNAEEQEREFMASDDAIIKKFLLGEQSNC